MKQYLKICLFILIYSCSEYPDKPSHIEKIIASDSTLQSNLQESKSNKKEPFTQKAIAYFRENNDHIPYPDSVLFFKNDLSSDTIALTEDIPSHGILRLLKKDEKNGFEFSDYEYSYKDNNFNPFFLQYGFMEYPHFKKPKSGLAYGNWVKRGIYEEVSEFIQYKEGQIHGILLSLSEGGEISYFNHGHRSNFKGNFIVSNPYLTFSAKNFTIDSLNNYYGQYAIQWKNKESINEYGKYQNFDIKQLLPDLQSIHTKSIDEDGGQLTNKNYLFNSAEFVEYSWDGHYFIDFNVSNDQHSDLEKWKYKNKICNQTTTISRDSFLFIDSLCSELPINSLTNIHLADFASDSWLIRDSWNKFNGSYSLSICELINDSIENTAEQFYESFNSHYKSELAKKRGFANFMFKRNDSIRLLGFFLMSNFNHSEVIIHRINSYNEKGELIDQLLLDRNYYLPAANVYFYSDYTIHPDFSLDIYRHILRLKKPESLLENEYFHPSNETMLKMIYNEDREPYKNDPIVIDTLTRMERWQIDKNGYFKLIKKEDQKKE